MIEPKLITCPHCEGRGEVVVDGYKPPNCKRLVVCPYCEGKKVIVEVKR